MKRFLTPLTLILSLLVSLSATGTTPLPDQFREPFARSFPLREAQHLQLKAYAESLPPKQTSAALAPFAPDSTSVAAYQRSVESRRQDLRAFFGVPPEIIEARITRFEKIGEDRYCQVFRVWVEVLRGVEAYGLYMLPHQRGTKTPLLIAQHGGGGTPESICDLDTRLNYGSFGHEAVKRGYIVWAPALTMQCGHCNDPEIPGADRETLNRLLKRAGTSIIGVELHKIIASTQALVRARPEIDADRIGMTGLSWGGFYTMHVTALSPFIKAAAPAAFLKDYDDFAALATAGKLKSPDRDILNGFRHAEIISMICPRPCLVQVGEKDEVVPIAGASKEAALAAKTYEKLGFSSRFTFQVHEGGHVYDTPAILDFFDREL
ncbi:MAG TPA: acetylxylan esterase [Opitutaceae bacterium]|nr:acetylxylan esterase [Opitutaceae bacterium]